MTRIKKVSILIIGILTFLCVNEILREILYGGIYNINLENGGGIMDLEEMLRKITQRKYHILEMRLSKYDLVKGQASLLLLIRDNDGITQNELASIVDIKDSSMSVRLDKLERSGYIIRETDLENLKKKRVYITTSGKTASIQCRKILREFDEKLYDGFTKKDKKQLEKYFEKMLENIRK